MAEQVKLGDGESDSYDPVNNDENHHRDGLIGNLYKVSIGNFANKEFETAHVWTYGPEYGPRTLSYLGDAKPPRFRVFLPAEDETGVSKLEWMDFHEPNIRGLIFEKPISKNPGYRVVFFVVDRPPQFYRCTKETQPDPFPSGIVTLLPGGDPIINSESGLVSRISHPSSLQEHADVNLDVCGVPWVLQYCRVFKLEFDDHQQFDVNSAGTWFRGDREDHIPLYCLQHGRGIKDSKRTVADMADSVKHKLEQVSKVEKSCSVGCRLGLLRLLYNCDVAATSSNEPKFLDGLRGNGLPPHSREHSDFTNRVSEGEASHIRALRDFFYKDYGYNQRNGWSSPSHYESVNFKPNPDQRSKLPVDMMKESERWQSGGSPGVFEILVYPSHLEIQGPVKSPSNSVLDHHQSYIEGFMRVRFVDNNSKPLKVEAGVDLETILEQRVFRVLTSRSPLLPKGWTGHDFLGYTLSSLKKRKAVWFLQKDPKLDANMVRNQIGDWNLERNGNLAHNPSKWGARISQAFTESTSVISLTKAAWTIREDYSPEGDLDVPNTDGCGLISRDLCQFINRKLGLSGFATSRAFQIRFGGVKGVVYAGANALLEQDGGPHKMILRYSQRKFRVPDTRKLDLRIVSAVEDAPPSLFFASALKAFEDSGADTEVIQRIYSDTYNHLKNVRTSRSLNILRQIFQLPHDLNDPDAKGRHHLLKLAIRLSEQGIQPRHYPHSFLAQYLVKMAEKARNKDMFCIPIPGSFSLLGLTDDYQVLNPKEVFVRVRGKTIAGKVLIYRNPVIFIGDIQEADAVSEAELRYRLREHVHKAEALFDMDNVIFFSQKDYPPLPNSLSGGDLDGDRFEILTKDCGFWGREYHITRPDNYAPPPRPPAGEHEQPFDWEQVARFIAQYIRNDCFAELEHVLLALAEEKDGGMNHADVKALARWLSQAVDYPKNGTSVNIVGDVMEDPRFRVQRLPDYLHAFSRKVTAIDPNAQYFQAPSLLGRIYRELEGITYEVPSRVSESDLSSKLSQDWRRHISDIDVGKTASLDHDQIMPKFVKDVKDQLSDYERKFYRTHRPEVNIFLRKQPGNFPNDIVQEIVVMVLRAAIDSTVAEWSNLASTRVRPAQDYDRDDVERVCKRYLRQAWSASVCMGGATRTETKMKGQGYAFLCLYVLYCEDLPIDPKHLD